MLVLVNAFFVATEFSLARLRPTQVEAWEREGRPGAKSVRHAIERVDAYLAACQLGITLASLGLGAAGESAFHDLFARVFGEDARLVGIAVAGALAFAIITLLHVVVGELSPKSVAIANTKGVALVVAPVMRVFYFATRPVVDLFNGLGNLILKPFGVPPAREAGHAPITSEELQALVRESGDGGELEPDERQFTENALTFGDRRTREVMVPRRRARFVTTEASFAEVVDTIRETGLTRLPLCRADGGLDTAIGVLHAKDLLVAEERALEGLARPVDRVPEAMLIDELLERLRRQREHFSLVVDEYGTVVGLITLEDVLEEIVGEIEDEFDPEHSEPIVRNDGHLVIAGWAPVRAVADAIGLRLDDAHEATIGGFLLEHLGRVPEAGETVVVEDRAFEITAAHGAQIDELRVSA